MKSNHVIMKGVIATASLLSVGAQVTTVMAAEEALSPEQVGQMSQQEVDSRKPQEEQRLQEVNIKIAESLVVIILKINMLQ